MGRKQSNTKNDGLLYEPMPFVPKSFWDAYNKLVPDVPEAPAGTKRLRIVWGMDRLEYIAGNWERRYGDTDHDPPKYVGRGRFVLEGWQNPAVFDKDEWLKDAHLLGDYPTGGFWDFVAFHANLETGEYLPLDQSALNHLEIWAHWQGQGQKRSIDELMAQKLALWQKRAAERQVVADNVAQEFGEQVVREFEKAKDTPNAFSLPTGYVKTDSGVLVPH